MDNKGFSLVELLVVIALLGLILLIAIPTYNSIAKAIKSSSRSNVIKQIENSASKYAFDTGVTILFADELVTEGYYTVVDEDIIVDPVDDTKKLNCYIIEVEKTASYYKAHFIDDGAKELEDGSCDYSKLLLSGASVGIMANGVTTNKVTWTKDIVILNAYSNSMNIDCVNNSCLWTSTGGARYEDVSEVVVNTDKTLETKYTFQYTIHGEQVERYTAYITVQIDKEAPYIYTDDIEVTDRYISTESKNVTINATDFKGSGISGYYLAKNTNQSCDSTSITYQESNKFTIDSNGTYKICVKDKVGNTSSYGGLIIDYIG